jgi:hypothetical protein
MVFGYSVRSPSAMFPRFSEYKLLHMHPGKRILSEGIQMTILSRECAAPK